jgi:hypothetical protein
MTASWGTTAGWSGQLMIPDQLIQLKGTIALVELAYKVRRGASSSQ